MLTNERLRDWIANVSRRLQFVATPARILLDMAAWGVATAAAIYLRLGLTFDEPTKKGMIRAIPVVAGLQILAGFGVGLYRRRWRYGSFDEVAALVATSFLTTSGFCLLNQFYFEVRPIPQSAALVGGVFGLVLMAGARYFWRLILERARRPDARSAEKLLVYGAGEGGLQVITALLRSRTSPYVPVGLLDDDPAKQKLSIMGVPVMGGRNDMIAAVQKTGATALLIALPSASAKTVGELADLAALGDLTVKVLPPVSELFDKSVAASDIRDLTEADLLGRHQIETNLEEIAHYLTGKRVLVTGAGGSIGSELCRQLDKLAPAELMMLDRDESALHQVQLSMHGTALLDTPQTILADIRDADWIHEVFAERRPEVVFHAAALKHLPLLERYPEEAYKSNVIGTLNVLEAAKANDVTVFVNISTDKAANPTSVLGYSKRVAERLTAHFAQDTTTGNYLSVRFGNVLGSRGSVLTTFREQIASGHPVTVTHPDVTRFFMTIPEAVQLVVQAGAIGSSGEVLVLDMGESVRIYDVARRLIAQAGTKTPIVVTGLRPGEKLHEDLFAHDEIDVRPRHRLISHTMVPPIDPIEVRQPTGSTRELMVTLR